MQQSDQALSGLNIGLVVSDDALRSALRLFLFVSGLHVREYRSTGEYLSLAADPNHCVVVDYGPPGMPGNRLCERLAAEARPVPLVVVTTSPETLRLPVHGHPSLRILRKPFHGQRLVDAIREAVDAMQVTPGGVPAIFYAGC